VLLERLARRADGNFCDWAKLCWTGGISQGDLVLLIRHEFRARAEDLHIIAIDSDSMEPILSRVTAS
jgi:hypothetical protein